MLIQDDMQTDTGGIVDDLIHELQPLKSQQIQVSAIVNPARLAAAVKELVGIRKANGIVAEVLYLV